MTTSFFRFTFGFLGIVALALALVFVLSAADSPRVENQAEAPATAIDAIE
jgi:hypothetical protein